MTDSDNDKELLENLDKMLKGNDEELPGLSDDSQSAVDFARKLASMGEKPSDEFRENLKAQIVHRLAEIEKEEESADTELVFWGIRRRKLWQGTLAALITVIIVAIILAITLILND